MLFALPSWRGVLPLVAVGVILLAGSVVLAGRDVAFIRSEAESEVLAFAETSALAIQFVPSEEIQRYLSGLLKHPAVATATVYSASGSRTVETRPQTPASLWVQRIVPSLGEPVIACRSTEPSVNGGTLCLQGDSSYYRTRLAALLIPHAILLVASACLLGAAIVLARGSNRRQVADLTRILQGATDEGNYSLRAREGKGPMGELAHAINALLEQMHQRDLILRRRTTELEAANRELEAFSYSVSHDLRSPLASIDGFSSALAEFYGDRLDESGKEYLHWIRDASAQMNNLVAGLLQMSRISRSEIHRSQVDLSAIAQSLAGSLRQRDSSREIDFRIEPGLIVEGDERLLHAVLENLMSNAYKFTGKSGAAMIAFGSSLEGGRRAYFVKDNGAGFDSTQAARMFTPFQRLHSSSEFEGTGIGLATVKRIVERHGGTIWADGKVGQGATFYFTLADSRGSQERMKIGELSGVE